MLVTPPFSKENGKPCVLLCKKTFEREVSVCLIPSR